MRRLLFAAALLAAASARGYEAGGHYFTVGTIVGALPSTDWRKAIVCSQLPDETLELDAINQVKAHKLATIGFVLFGRRGGDIAHVVTVHQLLHGLNGQPAAKLLPLAEQIVKELLDKALRTRAADDLCALGFALHLYGDAFAHRRLSQPDTMYGPVIGHASGGTSPDKALNEPSAENPWHLVNWQRYAAGLAQLTGSPAPLQEKLFDPARALVSLEEQAGIGETELRLRSVLRQEVAKQHWEPPQFLDAAKCQEVIGRMRDAAGIDCLKTWLLYRAVAEPLLAPLNQSGVAFFSSEKELP